VYAWNDIGKALASAINLRMDAVFSGVMSNNGVMSANFAVTRNPEIPSCLIETDFITSAEGEESTWDEATRKRVAKAIAEGISDWCLH
jgi:N-acetylmuramoyl-L-alanine amidase